LKICKEGKEVNLSCFHLQGYFTFSHFKKNYLLFYFSSIYLFKKIKTKNNLSKFNQKLRDVTTKNNYMIIKEKLKYGYEKTYII